LDSAVLRDVARGGVQLTRGWERPEVRAIGYKVLPGT
jgi:hypothetical protein